MTQTAPRDPTLHRFASCAGRLSALMEHQWLTNGPASETTGRQRAEMLALLDAIMAPDKARQVLNWRIEAKAAHAALLTRTTFGTGAAHPDRSGRSHRSDHSKRAQSLATRHVAQCRALLLRG